MSSHRVVLINDTPCTLKMMADLLERAGLDVDTYAHGKDALQDLRTNPPDLILLDQTNKPKGTDLFADLDHETGPPVIFVSANADDAQRILGRRGTPAADYISMPFSNRELIRRVKNLLD